ncbi:hypothetical protein SteCoe_657 [Stentor coeruleus]|uniref:Ion transport domain-containing protein n=1 Tax=Stentor coeruleus TaxID=5963 RepID=A0A1R2D3T5_9CILI|nr:hypothetical protein SteCoe_657 [Stentor coeruleus]
MNSETNPVNEFIQALSKGVTPFSNTIRLSHEAKILKNHENHLFIGLKNGDIIIFDLAVTVILKTFTTGEKKLISMDIDPKNLFIITIGEQNLIKYFNYQGQLQKQTHSNHNKTLTNMIIFNDHLYITDTSGYISYRDEHKEKIIQGHTNKISCIDKLDNIATGSHDCYIKIWDKNLSLIGSMKSEKIIHRICFINNNILVSAGNKSLFCIWDIQKYELSREIQSEENWVRSISPSKYCDFIISGTNDACVRYWYLDSKNNEAYESFIAHNGAVTSVSTNEYGSLIFTASKDRTVKVWQTCREIKVYKEFIGHTDTIMCLTLTNDDLFVYSAGADAMIMKWDLNEATLSKILKGHEQTITGIALIEETLVSVSEDKYAILWKNDLIYKKVKMNEYLLSVCISSGHIFVGSRSGSIYVFNYELGLTNELIGHFSSVATLVCGNDKLFSGSQDRTIKVWELENLENVYTIKAHSSTVKKLLCLCQEKKLMSVGCDKTLRIWFEGDPPLEICLKEHDAAINAICLNSNGWYTFTGDNKGFFNIWCNDELVKLKSLDFGEPIHDIVSLKTEPLILIALGNKIQMKTDLFAESQLMTVPNRLSFLYFLYLSSLLKGKSVNYKHPFKDFVVVPFRINLLHIMAYINDVQGLREAMKNGVLFLSSSGENPLRLALDQGSYQCVDAILKYIPIYSKKISPFIFKSIEKEFVELFSLNLKNLPSFLNEAFPVVKSKRLPNFGEINKTSIIISDTINIIPNKFELKSGAKDVIEFHGCVFQLPLNLGSNSCNNLIKNILKCENPEVFDQLLVQNILEYLMKCAYKYLVLMTLLNFSSILVLLLYFTYFQTNLYFAIIILTINTLYLITEILQMIQSWEYYSADFWNIIDTLRIISTFTSIITILADFNGVLISNFVSFTMLFNMIRMISLFRLFEGTRYMIRMIFEVVSDISSYLLVLLMTTLTIAISFYFVNTNKSDFTTVLLETYLMNFGQIDLAGYQDNYFMKGLFFFALFLNPLVMMNLLIATMGDTFSRIQTTLVISNYKEIASLVLEVSSFMVWKRKDNNKMYLQCCRKKEIATFSGSVTVKMKKMKMDVDRLLIISSESSSKLDRIIEILNK